MFSTVKVARDQRVPGSLLARAMGRFPLCLFHEQFKRSCQLAVIGGF